MPKFRTLTFATVLALSLPAQTVLAQGTQIAFGSLRQDSSLPIEMTSDTLSVNQGTGKAVFTGNVVIGQGEMRLTAETVEVVYTATGDKISHLLASGGVTIVNAGDAAEAQNAEYDIESSTIVLTGDVVLTQAGSAISGNRMVIDLNAGTGQMDGRVKTILQPGQN